MEETLENVMTQKLVSIKPIPGPESSVSEITAPESETAMVEITAPESETAMVEITAPSSQPDVVHPAKLSRKQRKQARSQPAQNRDEAIAHMLEERCQQLCLSTFFREHAPVRSLGFTSSIGGEGKSFLSLVTARVLAHDSSIPVTLLECNWEHPNLHEYFGFDSTPGLAEWLREECGETDIRYEVDQNLTVIPSGNGRKDAVKLLQKVRQKGLLNSLACSNEFLIVDLPAIVTTGYGSLAASLVESLIVVVHAGVTPDHMVAETCSLLKDLPVHGIMLNQLESRIPHWIQRVL